MLQRARDPNAQASETLADGKGFDLAAVPLTGTLRLILVPHRLGDTDVNDTIAGSQREYQHLLQRQRKVRLLGLSTLGLMTLLLLFASTWVAIHLARGLAAPIRSLAEASKEVARGNLSHRVDTIADDELALLAESFNQMTAELDENRRHIEDGATALREKNLALEERRNYIETVLESLSTGVVSLDQNDCVTTINTAAVSILKIERGAAGLGQADDSVEQRGSGCARAPVAARATRRPCGRAESVDAWRGRRGDTGGSDCNRVKRRRGRLTAEWCW